MRKNNMQDVPTTIHPVQGGAVPKQTSCWIYGLAAIGAFSIIVWIILLALLVNIWLFIRPLFSGEANVTSSTVSFEIGDMADMKSMLQPVIVDGNIVLTPEQLQLLTSAGINPDTILNQDPEELRACAQREIGVDRAVQLELGTVSPNVTDLYGLKRCLE